MIENMLHRLDIGQKTRKSQLDTRRRVLYASACAVTVPPCYSTVTLNCDLLTPKFNAIYLCPITHHRCKCNENQTNTFQDVLTSRESGFQHTLFHRDLDL